MPFRISLRFRGFSNIIATRWLIIHTRAGRDGLVEHSKLLKPRRLVTRSSLLLKDRDKVITRQHSGLLARLFTTHAARGLGQHYFSYEQTGVV